MSPALVMPQGQTVSEFEGRLGSETVPRNFVILLRNSPFLFLNPSSSTHEETIAIAKSFLDPLAEAASNAQGARVQSLRQKRKRGRAVDAEVERNSLQLRQLYTDGFSVDGIWGQARRILDASAEEIEIAYNQRTTQYKRRAIGNKSERTAQASSKGWDSGSDGEFHTDLDHQSNKSEPKDLSVHTNGAEKNVIHNNEAEQVEEEIAEESSSASDESLEDGSTFDQSESEPDDKLSGRNNFVNDKFGLNDGFFDIDEFNKESEFLERANANTEDESDEDEVDYFADPMIASDPTYPNEGRLPVGQRLERPDDSNNGEGDMPTFGNADLNAPWSDDEDNEDGDMMDTENVDQDEGESNANDIHYADFFDPPSQPMMKSKRMRALPKTQPDIEGERASDQDIQRTIDSVRRDLFEDDFSDPDIESSGDLDEGESKTRNLSSHEKRKIAIAKQIRALEASVIEKRSWQLSGEAVAHARPENALLEEDLDFERAGKPVPVITAEVSSSIEEMIKRRILDRQFDEVIKRQPGTDLNQSQQRRGLIELSDQKNPQSLAESYEQSYLAQTESGAQNSRSVALIAQHAEIEKLWVDVSGKLDALTSWRYKPKPPNVEVKIVTDAPKILMEDARPSGVEGVRGEQSGLAPQEVYRVGNANNGKEEGVVTTNSGGVIAKGEMTKDEKSRRRRREKERLKKKDNTHLNASTSAMHKADSSDNIKNTKTDLLGQLKAGGVKVIGKGGELRGVDGERIGKKEPSKGGAYKL